MKKITFGRLPDNDIVLDHQSVSRHHGYLLIDGSRIYIADNGSMNGITVDGERVRDKVQLTGNARVMIANAIKLDWQRYAPLDSNRTVRNDNDYSDRKQERPQVIEKPITGQKKTSFWDGQVGKVVKYILTMIVTMTIMTLISTFIRRLF